MIQYFVRTIASVTQIRKNVTVVVQYVVTKSITSSAVSCDVSGIHNLVFQ